MRLLQFHHNGQIALGVRTESGVIDVAALAAVTGAALPHRLSDVIADPAAYAHLAAAVDTPAIPHSVIYEEASLNYAPAVDAPEKIICVGLNYRRHVEETKAELPTVPVLFSKFNNALAAAGEDVPIPLNMQQADYEVELGVVIGRTARSVPAERALDYVFGYCTVNDLSARDWQFRTPQWLLGKTPDKFMPVGPYLVTKDEIPDPQHLLLQTWMNGELRQNSTTADMVFTVAQIIAYISDYMTLQPGDLISTGTPEGVILGMAEKHWIKPGDEVTVQIAGLGRCVTRFA